MLFCLDVNADLPITHFAMSTADKLQSLMSISYLPLDLETEILIASLIIEDLEEIQNARKGKSRANAPMIDDQLALQEQLTSMMSHMTFLEDIRLAKSLDTALRLDRHCLEALSVIDQAETEDHNAALALQRGGPLPSPSAAQMSLSDPMAMASLNPVESTAAAPVASSSSHNQHEATSLITIMETLPISDVAPPRRECVICADRIISRRSYGAPCGHHYCRACLVDLVDTSTRDESLFPLRCCKNQYFSLDGIAPFLTPRLLALVREKAIEFGTPSGHRVYCTNSACSTFLGPTGDTPTNLVCPQCATRVCSSCKNPAHGYEACTENAAVIELRALALAERWQTCPSCHSIVELSSGCFHITCRCRAEFCYLCAARWKNCICRQWDEDLIVNAAEQRVVNQFGRRAMHAQPALHAERVQQRIAELRVNHDCDNHNWRYRHGEGYCNECNHHLPIFMMRCTNCQILACKRCAQNRL